jgi:hypothetical protein
MACQQNEGEQMNKIFDEDAIAELVKKLEDDTSGKKAIIMQQIMNACERAGKEGFTLKEISMIGTAGFYLSQSPELRHFFDQLLSFDPDDTVYH